MLAAIAALGLPTAILTNGWSPLQEEKARLVGFSGTVLASDAIGARKPEPEAFAMLARALDTPADRIAYVGDDPAVDIARRSARRDDGHLARRGEPRLSARSRAAHRPHRHARGARALASRAARPGGEPARMNSGAVEDRVAP